MIEEARKEQQYIIYYKIVHIQFVMVILYSYKKKLRHGCQSEKLSFKDLYLHNWRISSRDPGDKMQLRSKK